MKSTIDSNIYTQIGLDSGSLTMLGSIVHSLGEPGEYRVALHHGESVQGVCTITADPASPAAQVTVDLAALANAGGIASPAARTAGDCGCEDGSGGGAPGNHFVVNPRGYVLFNVSGGSGGYYVHVRRIDADVKDKGYDSRNLGDGDLFTAVILRPGAYSVHNSHTKASGHIVVSYPKIGEKAYVPPPPLRVTCSPKSFEPSKLEVQPGQGVIFEAKASSRIVVKLEKADDGPNRQGKPAGRTGWTKQALK